MSESKKLGEVKLDISGDRNNTVVGNDNHIDNSTKNYFADVMALPSTLAKVINILGRRLATGGDAEDLIKFSIEHKKEYNNVQVYRAIMDEYGLFVGKLAAVYDECDAEGTNITSNTLSNIKLEYLKVRGGLVAMNPEMTVIEAVRRYADEIFVEVEQRLLANVVRSSNIAESMEAVHLSLQVVMIDAFIKCQILEKPSPDVAT